jgi:hypothetical protein
MTRPEPPTLPPWTTRLDPEHTRRYGVGELHEVVFEPPGWKGNGTTVVLGIPECELQFAFVADERPVVAINRPVRNTNAKHWTRCACDLATQYNAALLLICDTAEQAEIGVRRIALERMRDPATRVRDLLS